MEKALDEWNSRKDRLFTSNWIERFEYGSSTQTRVYTAYPMFIPTSAQGGRRRPDSGITRTEIFDSRARYSKQATVIFVLRIIIANKRCCYSHDGKERTKNKNFRQRYWKIGVYLSRGERRRTWASDIPRLSIILCSIGRHRCVEDLLRPWACIRTRMHPLLSRHVFRLCDVKRCCCCCCLAIHTLNEPPDKPRPPGERTEMESSRLNAERVSLLEERGAPSCCWVWMLRIFSRDGNFSYTTVTKAAYIYIRRYIYIHKYQVVERWILGKFRLDKFHA